MTWVKYDDRPIMLGKLSYREQDRALHKYSKPNGFWITVDGEDGWKEFCLSEGFNLGALSHRHEVEIDEARMLILRSAAEVMDFARRYRTEYVWGPPEAPGRYLDQCVDWVAVARDHSGIIIAPYQRRLRLAPGFSWYYGWDCASGCIWDPSAILDVRLVEVDLAHTGCCDPA